MTLSNILDEAILKSRIGQLQPGSCCKRGITFRVLTERQLRQACKMHDRLGRDPKPEELPVTEIYISPAEVAKWFLVMEMMGPSGREALIKIGKELPFPRPGRPREFQEPESREIFEKLTQHIEKDHLPRWKVFNQLAKERGVASKTIAAIWKRRHIYQQAEAAHRRSQASRSRPR